MVGIDLGAGRAWSAAVALWPSGRIEAHGAGGRYTEHRETRDGGIAYRAGRTNALIEAGRADYGRRAVGAAGADPHAPGYALAPARLSFATVFGSGELLDAARGRVPILPRTARWSSSTADIRAVRQDGA